MAYVLGVDLGTSAVKVLLVSQSGQVVQTASQPYPLSQPKPGYSEQNPEDWVQATLVAIKELVKACPEAAVQVAGLSFSGQMHGLVLLGADQHPLRPAILWNDTRTSEEVALIQKQFGDRFVTITDNHALEGFTLPKLLWVKRHEPEILAQTTSFVLPKDYVRLRLTGQLGLDYSDAAGTVMLDAATKTWSVEVLEKLGLSPAICPPLIEATDRVGTLLPEIAQQTGLPETVAVFGGGADNACGAIEAAILNPDEALCSIGTSGVILAYEPTHDPRYHGQLHYFNHAIPQRYYSMGVTLAAGYSLSWFKQTSAPDEDFSAFVATAAESTIGARGLLFSPYLVGERTPYQDSGIRASFIGMDGRHQRSDKKAAIPRVGCFFFDFI